MFERIRNGWELLKASARALSADRELLVFPLVSAIATAIVAASFAVPIALSGAWRLVADETSGRIVGAVVIWLFYFVLSTVAVYFNTALVGAALIRLEGGDPTLGDGLRIASSRLKTILGYAAISATVGLVLKAAQRRSGALQRWVISLIGLAWSLATFLVVPVLAARDVGPLEAVKESAALFKRTWGEQVVGAGGIKLITGFAIFGLILLGVPVGFLVVQTQNVALIVTVASVFVLVFVALILISSALQGIYTAALYRHATGGDAGFGFDRKLLLSAFQPR